MPRPRVPRSASSLHPARTRTSAVVLALGALAMAACADSATGPSDDMRALRPQLDVTTGLLSVVRVCKDESSPAGTSSFTANRTGNANDGDNLLATFQLTVPSRDGHPACVDAFTRSQADVEFGDGLAFVTITELPSTGTALTNIVPAQYGANMYITDPAPVVDLATRSVTVAVNAYHGILTTFFNTATAGCTYTQGWYKNQGAASLPVGVFGLSGKSYLEVLKTPPAGNPYYILAHQYIAASENIKAGLGGVDPAVVDALAKASLYFTVATPATPLPDGYTKALLTGWANTLDEYNNGARGPEHCE